MQRDASRNRKQGVAQAVKRRKTVVKKRQHNNKVRTWSYKQTKQWSTRLADPVCRRTPSTSHTLTVSSANIRNTASDRGLTANLNGSGILSAQCPRQRSLLIPRRHTYRKIELLNTTSGSIFIPCSSNALPKSSVAIIDTMSNHADDSTRCIPGHRLTKRA